MRTHARWMLLAPAVLLALSSCSRPPAPIPPPADAPLSAPPEAVWAALVEVYTDATIPIENMDRSSWFLRSDRMQVTPGTTAAGFRPQDLFDCGAGRGRGWLGWDPRMEDRAKDFVIVFNVTTLLRPQDDGTTLVRNRVNVVDPPECVSRGVLEQQIIQALQERL